MTFGASPMPNHRISQGVSAYFGMPCEARMKGSTAAVTRGDSRSRNGRPTPATQPMTKPIADTRSVAIVSVRSLPLPAISTMRCAVASGGAKNSGPKARAPHSQAASSATASSNAAAGHDPLPRDRVAFGQIGCDVGAAHCTSARMRS